jgi:3-dehydroquinate synthetase
MFDAISFDKKMQCDKLQMVVLQDFGKAMVCHLEQAEIADMIGFVVEFLKQKLSHLRS